MARLRSLSAVLGIAVAAACSSQGGEQSQFQAQDLTRAGTFDKDEIVPTAALEDNSGVGVGLAEITQFLRRTPYARKSFLSTYQSNGVRAIDAILAAANTYHLNPLVFLVRAEMDQQLVAEENYPSPPSRIEYAFGCGVTAAGNDPAFEGFDKQIACYGAALRASLDQITNDRMTAGGYAPMKLSITLDGVAVTPSGAATAALYQYEPRVAEGKTGASDSGNWLFWNIWQVYADALQYQPPASMSGGTPTAAVPAGVGDACTSDAICSYPDGFCAQGASYPGGLCLQNCAGDCPFSRSACVDLGQNVTSVCLRVCDPVQPQCRTGYSCVQKLELGTGTPLNVCF